MTLSAEKRASGDDSEARGAAAQKKNAGQEMGGTDSKPSATPGPDNHNTTAAPSQKIQSSDPKPTNKEEKKTNKRPAEEKPSCAKSVKRQCKSHNVCHQPKNIRSPRLKQEAVANLLRHKKGHDHKPPTGERMPHVLPFDIMHLACHCGKTFNQTTGYAFRQHLKNIPVD